MSGLTDEQREALVQALHQAETTGGFWGEHPECQEFADVVAPVVASLLAAARAEGAEKARAEMLHEVGQRIERHRLVNPMNHDGSNYMLDKVIKSLSPLGAEFLEGVGVEVERARQRASDLYERIEQMNRENRAGGERNE